MTTSKPDTPWYLSGDSYSTIGGSSGGGGGGSSSESQTIVKTTEPSTTMTTYGNKTTDTISKFTPTLDRPVIGDVVSAELPDAPVLPEFEAPTLDAVDPYVAPEVDEGRIASLTQRLAAPGVRTLRQALRDATVRRFDNPNVGALTLKSALQGYGTGLESVYGGAGETALTQEASERAAKTKEAEINYNQAVNDRNAIFNAEMHSEDANFKATIANISQVYGAEVAAEMQRVADTNTQNRVIFSTAMEEYLKTGTQTTTATTTGGDVTTTTSGGKTTQVSAPTADFTGASRKDPTNIAYWQSGGAGYSKPFNPYKNFRP